VFVGDAGRIMPYTSGLCLVRNKRPGVFKGQQFSIGINFEELCLRLFCFSINHTSADIVKGLRKIFKKF
jgi:hypothetical protein